MVNNNTTPTNAERENNKTTIWIIIALLGVALLAYFAFAGNRPADVNGNTYGTTTAPVESNAMTPAAPADNTAPANTMAPATAPVSPAAPVETAPEASTPDVTPAPDAAPATDTNGTTAQ